MALDPSYFFYSDGTITLTNGSDLATGDLVAWDPAVLPFDFVFPNNGSDGMTVVKEVLAVNQIRLAKPWTGPTLTNVPYFMVRWANHIDPRFYAIRVSEYLTRLKALPEYLDEALEGSIDPPKLTSKTGSFWSDQGAEDPVIFRMPERLFVDRGTAFNGAWEGLNYTGMTPTAQQLHGWAPRDASLYVDSSKGAMSIVGHSQASFRNGWPGLPAHTPAAIGVSGFAINDVTTGTLGQAWGMYADAVRMPGAGFTIGIEVACANLGDTTEITPYNTKLGGANSGVSAWIQSGGGLDAVAYPQPVNDIAAGAVFLSSFADNSARMGKGIVFDANSIRGTDGVTGVGTAVAFAKGHQIEWFNQSGQATSFIQGQATLSPNAMGLKFDDAGVNIVDRTGGTFLRVAPSANIANHLLFKGGTSGVAPTLEAEGSDANIDLILKPKAGGILQFGYMSGAATNPGNFSADRYIYIRQGDGTALAIPCRSTGW